MEVLFPKLVPEQDMLSEWLKRMRAQNSDLSIKRKIEIEDSRLIQVRDYLSDFFGADYFFVPAMVLKSMKLVTKDTPWIFQLLVNDDYPSLVLLFELCHILKETECYHPDLAKLMKSNRKQEAFRNYYFEALTYHLMRTNNMPHTGKLIVNGKEKEGFVTIAGTEFLFECKKLYSYQLPGIAFIFSVHEEFFRLWQNCPVAINCYMTVSSSNEEILRSCRNSFHIAFRDYFEQVKKTKDVSFDRQIKGMVSDRNVGRLLIEPYHLGLFENYTQLIEESAACFAIEPYKPKTFDDILQHMHGTHVLFKFEMWSEQCNDFLISKLDKKRKSQRDMKHMPRIFLFDNESYRGIEPPLFPDEGKFDGSKIQKYIESKKTDDIVCVVFRNYITRTVPRWSIHVFSKPSLAHYTEQIKKWVSLYQLQEFYTGLPRQLAE